MLSSRRGLRSRLALTPLAGFDLCAHAGETFAGKSFPIFFGRPSRGSGEAGSGEAACVTPVRVARRFSWCRSRCSALARTSFELRLADNRRIRPDPVACAEAATERVQSRCSSPDSLRGTASPLLRRLASRLCVGRRVGSAGPSQYERAVPTDAAAAQWHAPSRRRRSGTGRRRRARAEPPLSAATDDPVLLDELDPPAPWRTKLPAVQ